MVLCSMWRILCGFCILHSIMVRFHYGSSKDSDLMYLIGYDIGDAYFFLEVDGKKYVFLNIIDIGGFKEHSTKDVEAVDSSSVSKSDKRDIENPLFSQAFNILDAYSVSGEVVVPTSFPLHLADALRDGGFSLKVASNWCPERLVKSEEEIANIEEVSKHTIGAFKEVERILKESVIEKDEIHYNDEVLTSEFLKQVIEKKLLEVNIVCTAGLIVSSGTQTAMPHHSGKGALRPNETIIVDIFPRSRDHHYFSDMTRTYVKGEPSTEIRKMYEAVENSQRLSREALKPGISGTEAYEISAKAIKDAGFEVGKKGYVHSLGHGVGIDVHESPRLGLKAADTIEQGNVVTVEPGLYYNDIGGVRIEDTVAITEDGCRVLTSHESDWVIK